MDWILKCLLHFRFIWQAKMDHTYNCQYNSNMLGFEAEIHSGWDGSPFQVIVHSN